MRWGAIACTRNFSDAAPSVDGAIASSCFKDRRTLACSDGKYVTHSVDGIHNGYSRWAQCSGHRSVTSATL